MLEVVWNWLGLVLFLVEAYHVLGHVSILLRFRLLPRKDLVRIRLYFLVDGLSSFVTAFLYTGRLRWLVSVHVLQHLYYFFTWEKSHWAKRIVDWSSLDWFRSSRRGQLEMDNILGTLFDIAVHVCNLCILGASLSAVQILVVMVLAQTSMAAVLFNPRFAWASPSAVPAWVQKRVSPALAAR